MKASRPLWKTFLLLLFLILSSSRVSAHGGHDHAANGDKQDNLQSRGPIAVKMWCLVILLVSTFAGGVFPYFYGWNKNFLLVGTQFASRVFLGTSLIHVLADANSTFADLTSKTYPFIIYASISWLPTHWRLHHRLGDARWKEGGESGGGGRERRRRAWGGDEVRSPSSFRERFGSPPLCC